MIVALTSTPAQGRLPTVSDTAATVSTDSGMWLLWQPEAFAGVHDYDTWSVELEEPGDLARHIREGHGVPINIGQDMAAAFLIRVGSPPGPLHEVTAAQLNERESTFLVAASEPYLLVSNGGVTLSGIEGVMGGMKQADFELPAGRWAATVH